MSKLFKQILTLKVLPANPLAGLGMLIFALCLNGPRPTCIVNQSSNQSTQQITAVDPSTQSTDQTDSSPADDEDTESSQNTANTYEEIHDEVDILPHLIKKPYFSFFTPPSDTLKDGLTLAKLQRPPRTQA